MTDRREISGGELVQRLSAEPAFGFFVDLSNLVVVDDVDLAGRTLCGFDLSNTRFTGAVSFTDSFFKGISWFRSAEFCDGANFDRTCFYNDARFDDCRFNNGADFNGAEFRGIAAFDNCEAIGRLNLNNILANGNFSIESANLHAGAQLNAATIIGGLWSTGALGGSAFADPHCEVYGRIQR